MENQPYINQLIKNYLDNTLNKEQFDELTIYFSSLSTSEFHDLIFKLMETVPEVELQSQQKQKLLIIHDKINKQIDLLEIHPNDSEIGSRKGKVVGFINKYKVILIAASLLVVLGFGYFSNQQFFRFNNALEIVTIDPEEINPGNSLAVIRVGNHEFKLDSTKTGVVLDEQLIAYSDGSKIDGLKLNNERVFIQIPRGGQYEFVLSDGSKVWLNSDSELSYYPFEGRKERAVHLKGEAYFEVAKNPNVPFNVYLDDEKISVLGTKFNVNNYPNSSKTSMTLLEGKIQFKSKNISKILKPNEQLLFNRQNKQVVIREVDVSSVLAWKNGFFSFDGKSFEENLEEISRWYNIQVIYKGDLSNLDLGGKMSKGVRLSTFIKYLESNFGLHCQVTTDRVLTIRK